MPLFQRKDKYYVARKLNLLLREQLAKLHKGYDIDYVSDLFRAVLQELSEQELRDPTYMEYLTDKKGMSFEEANAFTACYANAMMKLAEKRMR